LEIFATHLEAGPAVDGPSPRPPRCRIEAPREFERVAPSTGSPRSLCNFECA